MNIKKANILGFTLIETLFALTIFSVVTLAILTMMITTINIYKNSEQQYNATLLAQRCFETIKASSVVNVGLVVNEVEGFIVTIDISEISKYNNKLYKIIIEVAYDECVLERLEGYKITPSI